jgi:hypothetical protein
MVRMLAADAGLLGLLVQENVFQDVATGVFIPSLDQAFNAWVSIA